MRRVQTSASDTEACYDLYDLQGRRVGREIDYFGPDGVLDERRRPISRRLTMLNGQPDEWTVGDRQSPTAKLNVDELGEWGLEPCDDPPRRVYGTEVLCGAIGGAIVLGIAEILRGAT